MRYAYKYTYIFLILGAAFSSCVDQKKFENIGTHEKPNVEYAPNMYYSVAYEPLSQITDTEAGLFVSSSGRKDTGEYYNSNPYNPHQMNMRVPAPRTVKFNDAFLPYRIPKDSLEYAAKTLVNPLKIDDKTLEDGKVLYVKFCAHCHGETGQGDGPVNNALKGVANLTTGSVKDATPGHIFHVITWGKGRMGAHDSQLNQEERWKIVSYVKENLQKAEAQQ
jgi:mono/diheme cytochrome c family protein